MKSRAQTIEFVEMRSLYADDGSPRAATDYIFRVNGALVTVRVHWDAVQTLGSGQLSPEEVKTAAQELIRAEISRTDPKENTFFLLDSAAMDRIAERLGWLDKFYSVAVSDWSSSVEEWQRAQAAAPSELPPVSKEQEDIARKFGVSVEQYRRGILSGLYGNRRQRAKARRLGERVQQILKELGSGYELIEVIWEGSRLRWLLRVRTPDRVVGIAVPFELADDAIDAGILQELERLKQVVISGAGWGKVPAQ